MQVFTRVVEANSFSRAADSLNIQRGSVTRLIKELEEVLHARLLNRTTRSLSLTSAGAAYYERCAHILADLEDAEATLVEARQVPKGKLRVDMFGAIGRLIVIPALADFHQRFPDVELTLSLGDRTIDLVQEGIDCAIRLGSLEDSTLVARRIAVTPLVTIASPSYLERFGFPNAICDLEMHCVVNYCPSGSGRMPFMHFTVDGNPFKLRIPSRLVTNDLEAHLRCGVQGLGLVQVPLAMAHPYITSGEVVEVLARWAPTPLPISAVYPHGRHLPALVRIFVDWMAELFAREDHSSSALRLSAESNERASVTANGPASPHTAAPRSAQVREAGSQVPSSRGIRQAA
ncbi:LysR substrate-binding domain-containing protein [Cupriavidus sp. 30B13]|uniref:LysR family transcriptional regulator n=1 Tax=Cupriavidus sp. 30B13 TaxID=3384241 RepID=UPI003B8FEAB0